MNKGRVAAPQVWTDPTPLRVLGMGTALPGPPVGTGALLNLVESRFGVDVRARGGAIARKLGIEARHICRPFDQPIEGPRPGQRNPELAAQAVRGALAEAGLAAGDLAYIIGHTATPATALPANVAQVAAGLGYHGPFAEFRQACTGFANALVFALCLLRTGSGPVAIVGSETGSVHFDPRRAAVDPRQLVNMLQMGDGAAAIVLAPDDGRPGARLSRVFHGQMGPGHPPGLSVPQGGSDAPGVPLGVQEFQHDYAAIRVAGPGLPAEVRRRGVGSGHPPDWMDAAAPDQRSHGRVAGKLDRHAKRPGGHERASDGQHRVRGDLAGAGPAPGRPASRGHGPGPGGRGDGAHVWRVPL